MNGYNKIILIGNVTFNSETRCTQSGLVTYENSLAVNEKRKNQDGEWVNDTTFIPFTMYNKLAETAGKYLTKGSPVMIEGKLKIRQWEKDGQKHSKTFVLVETMQFLGGDKPSGTSKPETHSKPSRIEEPDDGIPF